MKGQRGKLTREERVRRELKRKRTHRAAKIWEKEHVVRDPRFQKVDGRARGHKMADNLVEAVKDLAKGKTS